MRHFLTVGPAGSIPRLPRGMTKPPWATVLIAAAGSANRLAAGPLGARLGAVAVAPITVPAEKEHPAAIASSADHEPERIQAAPCSAPGGGGQSRDGVRKRRR